MYTTASSTPRTTALLRGEERGPALGESEWAAAEGATKDTGERCLSLGDVDEDAGIEARRDEEEARCGGGGCSEGSNGSSSSSTTSTASSWSSLS
jgi:hypothetical protein